MNANHSIELVVYGLMVAGLNLVASRIAPNVAGPMLSLLVTGGLLVMFTGVLGLCGLRRLFWPIVTLVMGLLMMQAARAWFTLKSGVDGAKPVVLIHSLLVFFAIMQLVDLAQAARHSRAKRVPRSGRAESAANDDGVNDENQKHLRRSLEERQ